MKLIDIEDLKRIKSNILECYNTEDRIYIFTKSLETDCRRLKDFAKNNLTLKQQFNFAEKSINLANDIYNMTDVVQQKILDLDRLYIDENDTLISDCNLIFEQEYDIADNETFKRLGNIIHMIFSGAEIIDYNISDTIPPDILKIIVRCITREYIFPKDVLAELKKSPIFKMIFGEAELNEIQDENEPAEPVIVHDKKADDDSDDNDNDNVDNDDNILNIYLNDDEPVKKKSNIKKKTGINDDIKRAAISLLIVVTVLLMGNTIIKKLSGSNEAEAINNTGNTPNGEAPVEKTPPEEEGEDPASDTTDVHFNEKLLESIGYTGNKAQKDTDIYVEGNSSMVVANDGQDKVKALFAAVDFTDENFNYMLMKQIGISAKIKSQYDTQAQIVFEAYKNGVIKSNFHTLVNVYDDIWSPVTVPINVTDADVLCIYLEDRKSVV